MPTTPAAVWERRGLCFDLAVCGVGLALFAATAVVTLTHDGLALSLPALVGVPLILLVARFPMGSTRAS